MHCRFYVGLLQSVYSKFVVASSSKTLHGSVEKKFTVPNRLEIRFDPCLLAYMDQLI